MEIGPIIGIRVVPAMKVPSADSDLPAVFDIENPARSGDDSYSSNGKKAAGGQDDEADDLEEGETEPAAPTPESGHGEQINYFA
jgi:hypothetical protein